MKPDERRTIAVDRSVGRYARKLLLGSASSRSDNNTPAQVDNFRRAAERVELRTTQVKQVLCAAGVSPVHFVSYRNFGLHLDKLCRTYSGATLRHLARSAIDYWTACGLAPEVLKAVAEQVFNLTLD